MRLRHLLLTIPLFLISSIGYAERGENISKINVQGEAVIEKEADQMEVALGVVTRGNQSGEALTQNHQLMNQVLKNLTAIGLDETEYHTSKFHIQPLCKKSAEGDTECVLCGYEVCNTILVKTLKLDLADKIISAAVQGGANQIHQISFSLHDPQMYRAEAIQAATQNAMADATTLATAAGVHIKRIISLTLNHWQSQPTPCMVNRSAKGGAMEIGQDPIEPGKVEIHAIVNAIFEITP